MLDNVTARDHIRVLGDQVHPTMQTLLPRGDPIYEDDMTPIHSAHVVHEYEDEVLRLPGSSQLPEFNIIKLLWSILKKRVRNCYPPPVPNRNLITYHFALSMTYIYPFSEESRQL